MQCSPKLKRCCAISGSSSRGHSTAISVMDFSQQSGNNAYNTWERKSYLLSPALLATSRSRRIWRTQRLGMGKPGSSLVRALAISVAFSTAILFAGTNPIVADPVQHHFGQLELHLQSPPLQPLEPLQPLQRNAHVEPKQWKPKEWVAPLLDKIAVVKVDSDTEDEYWVFDKWPFLGQLYVLRKQTTALEIVLSGFVAGCLVELTNALLLHPIDTLKTRLQRGYWACRSGSIIAVSTSVWWLDPSVSHHSSPFNLLGCQGHSPQDFDCSHPRETSLAGCWCHIFHLRISLRGSGIRCSEDTWRGAEDQAASSCVRWGFTPTALFFWGQFVFKPKLSVQPCRRAGGSQWQCWTSNAVITCCHVAVVVSGMDLSYKISKKF